MKNWKVGEFESWAELGGARSWGVGGPGRGKERGGKKLGFCLTVWAGRGRRRDAYVVSRIAYCGEGKDEEVVSAEKNRTRIGRIRRIRRIRLKNRDRNNY